MVFFTSPGQEFDELRLRRSSSIASIRSRSRRSPGLRRASSQPRISSHSHSPPLTEASNDVPPTRHDPSAESSSPSHMPALDAREQSIQDSKLSSQTHPPSQRLDTGSPSSSGPALNLGQRRPGITSSSTSSLRPKIYPDAGSVSDSGIVSRTSRPSQYLDVSLPGAKLHLLPSDNRHPSPSSPSISQAGYHSEGNAFDRTSILLHPSRLDVKRLLSKPAAPSIASTLSITSDSECHATPRAQPNPGEVWPSKSRIQDHAKLCTSFPTAPMSEPSDRSPAQSPPPSPQQRPRSLFRKQSASGRVHATTTVAPPRRTSSMSSPLRSIVSSPSAAPPRSQRSTVLQSVLGNRSAGSASASSRGLVKLTPAGAIAQAYKEQDIRREAFSAAARAETALPIIPSSSWLIGTRTVEEGTSFRTAPGSSLSCIGPMGGKDILGGSPGDHSRSSGSQPVKSLTRKVSARFRRGLSTISGAGGGDVDGEGEPRNNLRNDFRGGNPSNKHERQRSSYAPRPKRKPVSLRLSMDQPRARSGLEDSSADQRSGLPVSSESAADSASLLAQDKDTSAGGRLWKLVKRISGGGLRERFHPLGSPAPPVPAIPKELLPAVSPLILEWPTPAPDGVGGHRGAEADREKDHLLDSNPSISGVSPSCDNHPPPVSTHVHEHPKDPSTSSSPQSSEPASTQFFTSSHTPRSSFSSIIGTTLPPVPVPPRARSPSPHMHTRSRAKSCSSSPGHHPSTNDRQSSSSPPQTRMRKRSSPDIPTFSVADVVNSFIRRPSLVRSPRRHVPTRSLPRIVAPSPEVPPSRPPRIRPYPYTTATARQQGGLVDPKLAPGLSAAATESRNSHSSGGSTVRASSASPHTMSPSGTPTGPGPGARLTFREFGSPGQQAWTSQEKEDRWDDLLERSARAGGTLHLGAGSARLASDNIRFSTSTQASELSIR